MKGFTGAVALGAVVLAAFSSGAAAENVVTGTDKDFDDLLKANKFNLVEFYAPWCGHCKALKGPYEEAATHFKGEEVEGGLALIAVDATENKELAERFGVQGFPTLKWFVDGEESDYSGGRTKDEIVAWISKKTGPPAETIASADDLEALKGKADVVVLGVFDSTDSDAAKAFVSAAQADDDAPYGISTEAAVREAAGLSGEGVVLFRNFADESEPKRVECEGEITKESVKKCVSANVLPLVIPFSQSNAPKIFGGSVKQHVLLFTDKSHEHHAASLKEARPVAEGNKGEYLFVTVDKTDDRILDFFGIQASDLPTARIVVMGDGAMKKFAMDSEGITQDELQKFVDSHKSGELKQALKSEADIADEDQKEDVWVLVGKNHDRVAFESGKNVLIEYYAPWCGHCKKLAPIYDELGKKYADDDNVVIAKMDATANEVESVSVQGFPTLKFVKAGTKELMDFDGSRDLDGLSSFIEKNRA